MQGVPSISSDSPDPIKYKLYGVIVHSGITNDGHYYCYLNINGWYKFNDTIVTKVSKEEALFHNFGGSYPYKNREKIHNAYILLYIDEKEYENIVLNEIIISDFLKNKIIESESGKTLNINFIQRSDIFNYMGIGLFRNINKRNLQVRSDDTLYVLTKDSYKRNSYIYDTSDFSLLSNDSGIEENKSYYLHECNEKKKKDDFLLFFKKYSAADNCFFVENISLVVNHSVFVSKNEKISEFKEKTFLSDDLLVFYAEEEEISEENVNSIKNDIENNHIDTRRDLGNVKIFKDDNSLSSNSETVKKEVNEIIEEKIKNTKELKIKYKLRILDLDKSFEENNLKDGSIICILNKENEERFLNEYEYINNSKLISFITEKNTRQFYIDKKFIYGELLNFVKKIYMNKDLEIVKFEGSLDFNKIEKVIIKGVKENKIIGFCCAVNAFNLNKIKHRHEIICDSLKVKNIVKKISNLECVKKALKNDHLELYTRNDVHEELNVEDGFNKKIYDNIKENYRIFEVFEENPIMKEYEFVDEITGDGLLVLREKTKYKEIRIMFYNGEKFLGLPIFISIEKDKFTLGNLREKYSIVTELFKFDGEDLKQIDNDERLDKFDITDILVNITQYI
ncbi:Ubiquitin carboxyl-terminal hydrolase 7 [Gurleya vavrai]